MKNEVRPIDANATIEALRANFQQGSWYGCEEPGYQIAEETVSEMPTIGPYPAHIDREAWETCEWCGDLGDSRYKLYAGFCMQKAADDIYEEETEKLNYCPKCGRPLTEEAWARLEKRLCRGSEKED